MRFQSVARGGCEIRARNCVVQLFEDNHPTPLNAVFRESHHVLAMQQQRRHVYSKGRLSIPGAEPDFAPIGRLLFVPADVALEVCAQGGWTRAIRCCFTQEVFAETTGLSGMFGYDVMPACLDIHSQRMTETLARLDAEIRSPGLASKLLVESLGASLMIELARHIEELPLRPAIRRGGLSRRTHGLIVDYIEQQNASASLDDLCGLTGLSRRHLSRAFKETTGRTVHEFVERKRFERASLMLADTDLLIKDIAFKLGFSRTSSFSVAFRRAAGEPPQAYRERLRLSTSPPSVVVGVTTEREGEFSLIAA